jgi:hypothetical protein
VVRCQMGKVVLACKPRPTAGTRRGGYHRRTMVTATASSFLKGEQMGGLTNAVVSGYTGKEQRRFCDEARATPEQANSFYGYPRYEDRCQVTVGVFLCVHLRQSSCGAVSCSPTLQGHGSLLRAEHRSRWLCLHEEHSGGNPKEEGCTVASQVFRQITHPWIQFAKPWKKKQEE